MEVKFRLEKSYRQSYNLTRIKKDSNGSKWMYFPRKYYDLSHHSEQIINQAYSYIRSNSFKNFKTFSIFLDENGLRDYYNVQEERFEFKGHKLLSTEMEVKSKKEVKKLTFNFRKDNVLSFLQTFEIFFNDLDDEQFKKLELFNFAADKDHFRQYLDPNIDFPKFVDLFYQFHINKKAEYEKKFEVTIEQAGSIEKYLKFILEVIEEEKYKNNSQKFVYAAMKLPFIHLLNIETIKRITKKENFISYISMRAYKDKLIDWKYIDYARTIRPENPGIDSSTHSIEEASTSDPNAMETVVTNENTGNLVEISDEEDIDDTIFYPSTQD